MESQMCESWNVVNVESVDDSFHINSDSSDSSRSLYQLECCAAVSAQGGRVTRRPAVVGCTSGNVLGVAIDHQLTILQDAGHRFVVTLDFSATIDTIACTNDGAIIVVADRGGDVHVVDVASGRQLASRKLEQPSTGRSIFATVQFGPARQLGILTTSGRFHVIVGWDTGDPRSIKHSMINAEGSTTWAAFLDSSDVVTCGNALLQLWHLDGENFTLWASAPLLSPAVKCCVISDTNLLVILDGLGQLSVWSLDLLVALSVFDGPHVADFLLLDRPSVSGCTTLVVLTAANEGASSFRQLLVCTLPRMQCIYSTNVETFSSLLQSPTAKESVFVVESMTENTTVESSISGIRVRRLAESDPQSRLDRLLSRELYTEAESFAKTYGLDLELVHRSRVLFLLEQLSPFGCTDLDRETIDQLTTQLLSCLDQIGNVEFVVECCLECAPPQFDTATRLLDLAYRRLTESKSPPQRSLSLKSQLTEALHRLGSFQIAFGAASYTGTDWAKFRSADIVEEFHRWLQAGDLEIVSSLWCRYGVELAKRLASSSDQLHTLLSMIPDDISLATLRVWLVQGLVPFIAASQNAELVDILARWIERRAVDLEVIQKSDWPTNAMELCDILSFESVRNTVFRDVTPKEYASCSIMLAVPRSKLGEGSASTDALVRLRALASDLRRLHDLHKSHRCLLSLEELRRETVETIAYRMLDRVVAVELVSRTISDTVKPYAVAHGLDMDKLLTGYVEDLAHRRGVGAGIQITAAWESKSVEVLRCIRSPALRVHGLLSILSTARFPWGEDVSTAVAETVAANPGHLGLQEQCRLAKLKHLLIEYDLRTFNVAETASARDLAYFILLQDRAAAVRDALEVVAAYSHLNSIDVYLFRCCFLVENDRMAELHSLLRELPADLSDTIAERLVRRAMIVSAEKSHPERRRYLSAACTLLKSSYSSPKTVSAENTDLISEMRSVLDLDCEFNELISLSDYRSRQKREKVFERHEKVILSMENLPGKPDATDGKKRASAKKSCTVLRIYRLADLLKISRDDIRVQRALEAVNSGDLTSAVDSARHIMDRLSPSNSDSMASGILRIVHAACDLLSRSATVPVSLPLALHRLVSRLVSIISPSMLSECLQLARALRLAAELVLQCDVGDFTAGPHSTADPYSEWTFDDYLPDGDGGLVIDAKLAVPVAYEFVNAVSPSACEYQPVGISLSEMIYGISEKIATLLKSNGQNGLYLGYYFEVASLFGSSIITPDLTAAVTAVMQRALSQRRADYRLALACACSLPIHVVYDTLKQMALSAGVQYKKVLAISHVGLAFAQLDQNEVMQGMARSALVEAEWGYRLAKLRISFRSAFTSQKIEKAHLIPTFARCAALSVAEVVDYCESFGLSVAENLMLYLRCLLIPSANWDGSNGETLMNAGDVGASSANGGSAAFYVGKPRALDVCRKMRSLPMPLAKTLEQILDKLDPYDYERIEFVLDRLLEIETDADASESILLSSGSTATILQRTPDLNERDKKLIMYLKSYHRVAVPSDTEMSTSNAATASRLPFHTLTGKDHWRVITPELNADTVDVWVPVAQLLCVPVDQIYTTALRNIVQERVRGLSDDRKKTVGAFWTESNVDGNFVETAAGILSRVVSGELAMACAMWIAGELPHGAEKAMAYGWCVLVAERWSATCSRDSKQKVAEVLEKHRLLYRKISIEQVLHVNQLAEPDLLALANSPARLIFRLYEHQSIVDRIQLGSVQTTLPDIHTIVDQIARIGSIDANKVRLTLVEKWLPSKSARQQQEMADVTMSGDDITATDTVPDSADTSSKEEETDLARVMYILEHGFTVSDSSCLFLINYVMKGAEDDSSTAMCRARALRCLFTLADLATIVRLSDRDRADWHDRLVTLLYTTELKRLRVLPASGSFESLDKSALARAVCRSHDPRAPRLAACLGVDFAQADSQLWAGILRRLSVQDVRIVLRPLPWRDLQIAASVQTLVTSLLSSDTLDPPSCVSVFEMIRRCPSPIDAELSARWAAKFASHGCPACVVGCVLLMSPKTRHRGELLCDARESDIESSLQKVATYFMPTEDRIRRAVTENIS